MANSESKFPVKYLDDVVVLSEKEAWTYVRLPSVSYEFLTAQQRISLMDQMTISLANLTTASQEEIDVHIRIVHRPFPYEDWYQKLHARARKNPPAPGWENYLKKMVMHVAMSDFREKRVYLGVKLGDRSKDANYGTKKSDFLTDFIAPLKSIVRLAEKNAGFSEEPIPPEEIEHWTKIAGDYRKTLKNSYLKAEMVKSDELAWVIASPLWPEMPQPEPTYSTDSTWNESELYQLAEGTVTHNRKWLKVEQTLVSEKFEKVEQFTGYTAFLSVSRFPDVLYFPAQMPWVYMAESSFPFPVDFSIRMAIVPPMKVKKDVSRKLADAKDQAQHIAETGAGVPLNIREQVETATTLEYLIDKERTPWAYSRTRLVITADSEDELKARCKRVIEEYRELSMDLAWPSGDQLNLLLEVTPGCNVKLNAYEQRQDLAVITGGMPTASNECGDVVVQGKGWVGPYIGWSAGSSSACFFSANSSIAKNKTPGVAITGAPGGGKSFLAFKLAYDMAMQGVWTIFIDPKADATSLAKLEGLGKAKNFDLRHGSDGMLDPFNVGGSVQEGKLLAIETLRILLGGFSEEREELLSQKVEEISQMPNPSLFTLVESLTSSSVTAERNVGRQLNMMKDLEFARLCFSQKKTESLKPEDGLTVVTLLGLDLPDEKTQPRDYSYTNKLAVAVMNLLARYARKLMLSMDKNHAKAIFIDEAWAITSTPQGVKLIPEIARMGRSHNTALILVSQNAGDLMKHGVANNISTRFAFAAEDPAEIKDVLKLLDLSEEEGYGQIIGRLSRGECIMKDAEKRIAHIKVDVKDWNEPLWEAFNTNPDSRKQVQ